jgi:monoamine oxidase
MMANTVTENGGDPGDQSALDLIELLSSNRCRSLQPLPGDDERYRLIGGNDQLVTGMIAQLAPEAVTHDHVLVAIRANADRTTTLSFDTAAGTVDVTADYAVLALPFSTLRDVDLSKSGLPADKRRVIRTMGMGTNAKIHLELSLEDHWALDPWVKGAYSYYRVGQASSYGAIAGRTEGRILFAGEHTSIANIGFLDGAVETGERAACRLLHRLF